MRSLFLLLTVVLLGTSCKKETGCTDPGAVNYSPTAKKAAGNCVTVEKRQLYLLTEFTAIWCPPCGSWGTAAFRQMMAEYPDQLIGMAVHGSSSQPDILTIAAGNELLLAQQVGAFPSFRLGTVPVAPSTIQAGFQTYANEPITASGAMIYTLSDDQVQVDARVQFYAASADAHYLGVYLLENGIPGGDDAPAGYDQQGDNTTDYTHDHVLRAAAGDTGFGILINDASATSSTAKNIATTLDIPAGVVPGNTEVIGVIWKRQGNDWIFVNAFYGVNSETL